MQHMHSTTAWKCSPSAINMSFWGGWNGSIADASKGTVAMRAEHRIAGRSSSGRSSKSAQGSSCSADHGRPQACVAEPLPMQGLCERCRGSAMRTREGLHKG